VTDDDRDLDRWDAEEEAAPESPGGDGESEGEGPDPLSTLESKVEAARASETQLRDQLLRLAAEFDNYRKRSLREAEAAARARTDALVSDLLEVLDNFERGLQADVDGNGARAFREGMELVYKRMREILARHGVEEIYPEGDEFDPRLHEAIHAAEEPGVPPNRVLQVAQKGYRISDRLLRPARVVVSK
jgi:molecular chaperone GrpE